MPWARYYPRCGIIGFRLGRVLLITVGIESTVARDIFPRISHNLSWDQLITKPPGTIRAFGYREAGVNPLVQTTVKELVDPPHPKRVDRTRTSQSPGFKLVCQRSRLTYKHSRHLFNETSIQIFIRLYPRGFMRLIIPWSLPRTMFYEISRSGVGNWQLAVKVNWIPVTGYRPLQWPARLATCSAFIWDLRSLDFPWSLVMWVLLSVERNCYTFVRETITYFRFRSIHSTSLIKSSISKRMFSELNWKWRHVDVY